MESSWFALLIAAICFEGLGRKYLPSVPAIAFYILKDVILVAGIVLFRTSVQARAVAKSLFGSFMPVMLVGVLWTVIEVFNPANPSMSLGLLGLRAYWLWWLAPVVVAGVLQKPKVKRHAIYALLVVSIGISILAAVQFASPPTAAVNLYSVVDGEELYADIAAVSSTGRARVCSTFTFISGFSDFTILVPALLLSIGFEARERRLRTTAFLATGLAAAVVPMSGSRSSIVLGAAVLVVSAWSAGLLFTRIGRRVMLGGIAAAVLSVALFPDAFLGVQSRFDADETTTRLQEVTTLLPPVAMLSFEYPFMGIGTGMQQNARGTLHINADYVEEIEMGRYLVELGPIGFVMIWTVRLGLMLALLRAYKLLKRAGKRGAAAAALSYAVVSFFGNLTFDHVWQALYFTGCGFILAELVPVLRANREAAEAGQRPVLAVAR